VTPSRPFGTDGGIGAVELATRFSMMDLNRGGMSGGELDQMSFIINWYLNDAAKVQLMYSHADLERTLEGRGQTDIFVSRFQVLF
jgi:phosphate-selective porin OprO/OprP